MVVPLYNKCLYYLLLKKKSVYIVINCYKIVYFRLNSIIKI